MTANNIEIKNLTVKYDGFVAVKDVTLTVPAGTVCVVLGRSGCGKSTLLKTVAGLQKNIVGEILVAGAPLGKKMLKIGFMPQNYGLFPWQTVEENILLPARIKKDAAGEKKRFRFFGAAKLDKIQTDRLNELLLKLGLHELKARYPHELSGGQQQRVALARAFFMLPDVLLMDEPFSALDAITREEMQDVFAELRKLHAVTTILVTHNVEEAICLGNTIAVMKNSPGEIAVTMPNPLFGVGRHDPQFFSLGQNIRGIIRTC